MDRLSRGAHRQLNGGEHELKRNQGPTGPKTITAIYQAFEELILITGYEKITVAELARRA
ncbi:hypothetical protein [Limosilactobacillus fermentum]|uniref:hypothetical protein n=1 Tax=Limosilactobacillus fermentum TaxID=1613 RepID=UPI002F26BBD8